LVSPAVGPIRLGREYFAVAVEDGSEVHGRSHVQGRGMMGRVLLGQ